ncbi:hypothetical protein IF2G_05432 [Cordyceps javanica]|nr:hypothetical protein IF2G_05432 [Cordyceps javanica]
MRTRKAKYTKPNLRCCLAGMKQIDQFHQKREQSNPSYILAHSTSVHQLLSSSALQLRRCDLMGSP